MALIGANELKKKLLIEIDGQPYNVLDVFFATPTARGASTMVRTRLKNRLNAIIGKHTAQPVDIVEKACDRDNFMTPEEAKAFGLVDEVVASRKEVPGLPEKSSVSA